MIAKVRNSNFELLRIISIVMIIVFHLCLYTDFVYSSLSVNKMLVDIFIVLGEIGVNCFLFISGYYLVESEFKSLRVIKFELELLFYSILISLFVMILRGEMIAKTELVQMFVPFTTQSWWFASCYMILLMLCPFVNIMIKNLTRKQHRELIILCLVIWSVIPTFTGFLVNNTESAMYFTRVIWFFVIYVTAAYIRVYNVEFKHVFMKLGGGGCIRNSHHLDYGIYRLEKCLLCRTCNFSMDS